MTGARRRLLSIATLYPNAQTPRFGTFVARSLEALAERGDWDVTVINPIGMPPVRLGRYSGLAALAAEETDNLVAIHRPQFTLIPKFGGPINPWMIARSILPLASRLHAQVPFDLVDAQFFYPDGPAAARIADALGLPYAIKARGADISYWSARPLAKRQMLAASRRATRLLAVSQALAGDMAAMGMSQDKIAVHYTGLDKDLFHPMASDLARARLAHEFGIRLEPQQRFLVAVGALIPRKGQALAIEALREIPNAILGLAGKGPDRGKLERLARRLGLADRVRFIGSLDHETLPSVLSASDVMVLPSASEGLANAWVEALACGTPIVIAEVGGARELLKKPEAGRIAARDPGAIAAAINELLAVPPDRQTVSGTVSAFSWQAHATRLAEYYESIIEG